MELHCSKFTLICWKQRPWVQFRLQAEIFLLWINRFNLNSQAFSWLYYFSSCCITFPSDASIILTFKMQSQGVLKTDLTISSRQLPSGFVFKFIRLSSGCSWISFHSSLNGYVIAKYRIYWCCHILIGVFLLVDAYSVSQPLDLHYMMYYP